MLSRTRTGSAWTLPLMLVMTCWLAGCQSIPTIRTDATDTIVVDVCRVWQPVTWSSRDIEQTQIEARANNAARAAYCK